MFCPKVVFFDMDGLIFDTERLLKKHSFKVVKELGYEINDILYERTIGTGGANIVEVFSKYWGEDAPYKDIIDKIVYSMNVDISVNGLPIKKGLISLLKYLNKLDIPCCIASSSSKKLIDHYLNISGISEYFSYIVSGDDVEKAKPDPDIFEKATQYFDIEPQYALVLEDSKNGIKAAAKANIPVICIPDLVMPDEEMLEDATLITSSLENVINLIDMNDNNENAYELFVHS